MTWVGRVVLALAGLVSAATAHESRPLHVEIVESRQGAFIMQWRTPASIPPPDRPWLELPAPACEPIAPAVRIRDVERQGWRCAEGLGGGVVRVRYPELVPRVSTLIRLVRASGEVRVVVLAPGEGVWPIPPPESRGFVAREYLGLGMRHLLEGWDHLLFLACMVFLARIPRRIAVTVTGFTLAHSLTLAATALGWVRVPAAPVEAAIALSIVFVASEIARGRRDTLTQRQPIVAASSFGLLHGFGFAAVLREIGLPQTELPTALLFFNLGVEAGQLLFLAALAAAWQVLRLALPPLRALRGDRVFERLRLPLGYTAGLAGSFVWIERLSRF